MGYGAHSSSMAFIFFIIYGIHLCRICKSFDHGGADFMAHRNGTLTLGRYANGWQREELILRPRKLHICLLLAFSKGCALMLVNLLRNMKKKCFLKREVF